jgi:hypothetical protein
MKVFVSGAMGYMWRAVVRRQAVAGHDVVELAVASRSGCKGCTTSGRLAGPSAMADGMSR